MGSRFFMGGYAMKMIHAAAVLTVISLLAGCKAQTKEAKPDEVSQEFDKTVMMTFGGREYSARLRRGAADVWECEFTEPECIAGLTLTTDPEGCRMSFEGLEYLADNEDVPEYALMPLMTGALEDVMAGREVSCTQGKNSISELGQVNGMRFTAKVSGGEITELEIPDRLTAKFKR